MKWILILYVTSFYSQQVGNKLIVDNSSMMKVTVMKPFNTRKQCEYRAKSEINAIMGKLKGKTDGMDVEYKYSCQLAKIKNQDKIL